MEATIETRSLFEEIQHGKGYALGSSLPKEELSELREIIKSQWLYRIQLLKPESVKDFNEASMTNYHTLSHLIDHETVWPSSARVLPYYLINYIKQMTFFKKIEAVFGKIEIADEEQLGWGNMLWRLVRPGNTDCGPIHADRWFWDLAPKWKIPDYPHERLNVWIAVHTVANKNGLLMVPYSQKRQDWRWHYEIRYGKKKPVLDEDVKQLRTELLPTESGEVVIFSHDLLHGGAVNHADSTRVSLEFTLFVPK